MWPKSGLVHAANVLPKRQMDEQSPAYTHRPNLLSLQPIHRLRKRLHTAVIRRRLFFFRQTFWKTPQKSAGKTTTSAQIIRRLTVLPTGCQPHDRTRNQARSWPSRSLRSAGLSCRSRFRARYNCPSGDALCRHKSLCGSFGVR